MYSTSCLLTDALTLQPPWTQRNIQKDPLRGVHLLTSGKDRCWTELKLLLKYGDSTTSQRMARKVWRSVRTRGRYARIVLRDLQRAMREVYLWSKIIHPNIQELLGVILFQDRVGMVSPWRNHGNLQDYIKKHRDVDRYALVSVSLVSSLHLFNQA